MNDARNRSDRALLRNARDPIGGREVRFHDTRLTRDCSIEEDREAIGQFGWDRLPVESGSIRCERKKP